MKTLNNITTLIKDLLKGLRDNYIDAMTRYGDAINQSRGLAGA